jgi:hypothetical protein
VVSACWGRVTTRWPAQRGGVASVVTAAVKSTNLGGSGISRASQIVFWPGVPVERCATRPSGVARVTRCIQSSSGLMLRHVSPVVFSVTRISSRRQPTQLDVSADPVLTVMEHRPQTEGALHVAPATLDGQELLVGGGEVLGGEGDIGGAQQSLAVQVRLTFGSGGVDAQQPGLGPA